MGFSIRTFDVFKVRSLIAVGTVVGKRGIGAEAVMIDVKVNRLCQYAMSADICCVRNATNGTSWLVGDDIDDSSDGVGAIERRGCSIEHFNALYPRHVDAV